MIKIDLPTTDEERYLPKAIAIINDVCRKLSLPKVISDDAVWIYRKILKKGISGRTSRKMIVTCVYAGIRRSPVTSRTLNELARVSDERKTDIQRVYRKILSKIELNPGIPDPEQKISKIINALNLSSIKAQLILRASHQILNKAKKSGILAGKNPNGLAAAAVYLACKENLLCTSCTLEIGKNVNLATKVTGRKFLKSINSIFDFRLQ